MKGKEVMTKPSTKHNSQKDSKKFDWNRFYKPGFFVASALALILLVVTVALLSRPPEYKYVYLNSPDYSSSNSSSSETSNSSSSSTTSGSSTSTPTTSSKERVTTYSAGEASGTSAKGVTISIEQVIRDYQGASRYAQPEGGNEYIQLTVKFTNNSSSAIYLSPSDFVIRDADGLITDAEFSSRDTATNYFPLTKELAGGSSVTGVMLFEVAKKSDGNIVFAYEKDSTAKRIVIDLSEPAQ